MPPDETAPSAEQVRRGDLPRDPAGARGVLRNGGERMDVQLSGDTVLIVIDVVLTAAERT